MSFFQELQRRKVIRTVLAYGAAAFVAAQITQLLVDTLDLNEWILKACQDSRRVNKPPRCCIYCDRSEDQNVLRHAQPTRRDVRPPWTSA